MVHRVQNGNMLADCRRLMENSVEVIMSKKMETVDVSETAEYAAKKMKDKRIGSLFVVDKSKGDQPIGVITERDLVHRVCAEGINSKDVGIQRLMSSPIATVESKATVGTAASLMLSNKSRHLLVVGDNRQSVGVITSTDLARYLKANMDVNEIGARILDTVVEEGTG